YRIIELSFRRRLAQAGRAVKSIGNLMTQLNSALGRWLAFGGSGVEGLGNHHIRDVNRTFAFDDSTLGMLLTFAHMPLNQPHPFDYDAFFLSRHTNDPPALALIGAGNHHHILSPFHMKSAHKSDDFRGE